MKFSSSLPPQNTFILKRRWPPKLHKKGSKPEKLRGRHFVYDLVEDTSVRPKPNLEVILTSFVEGFGQRGDVLSVKNSVAYNKLLLPGLAVYKTPENLARYAKAATTTDENVKTHSSPFAERTVSRLEARPFAIIMNKHHPWKIEPWHVRVSLRKAGININSDAAIELPEQPITGPDLLKQNKEFIAVVTLNNLEKARIRCRIHHWTTDPAERLPYVFEHWKLPAEPLITADSENKG